MTWRRRAIPVASVAVALLAIVIAIVVTVQRRGSQPLSDVITTVGEGRDPRHQVLLPRLQRRTVVVVDRPHNPDDSYRPGQPPPGHVNARCLSLSHESIQAKDTRAARRHAGIAAGARPEMIQF